MPLLFAYTHILFSGTYFQNILSVVAALVGTLIFSMVTMGLFIRKTRGYESILLGIAAFLAYTNHIGTFVILITLITTVFVIQKHTEF